MKILQILVLGTLSCVRSIKCQPMSLSKTNNHLPSSRSSFLGSSFGVGSLGTGPDGCIYGIANGGSPCFAHRECCSKICRCIDNDAGIFARSCITDKNVDVSKCS